MSSAAGSLARNFDCSKFSRLDPNDLDFSEDPGVYSKSEINALTAQIHSGNLHNGGLQKVCEVRMAPPPPPPLPPPPPPPPPSLGRRLPSMSLDV